MNDSPTTIADRVALITGGSAGLGRALVHALLADGWTVVTDARRTSRLDELAAGLPEEQRGRLHAIPGDVTDPVHRMAIQDTVADLGRLDLLINNASALASGDRSRTAISTGHTTWRHIRRCSRPNPGLHWSDWLPLASAVSRAGTTPGVYVIRSGSQIVYVGRAGVRGGSGIPGRLRVYAQGRGAVSGFGEAALDRVLADPTWFASRLDDLKTRGPMRTKE